MADGTRDIRGPGAGTLDAARLVPELVDVPEHLDVLDRLDEVAAALPDQLAVTADDGELTFAELTRRAYTLAAELSDLLAGAPARQPVAVLAEQNSSAVAAAVAVLATGHPFLLLDVTLPEARLAQIVTRCGADVVLTDTARSAVASALPGVRAVRGLLPAGPDRAVGRSGHSRLDDSAAVIVSSGTTGTPKAIDYLHRTVLANAAIGRSWMRLGPGDRVALVMPWAYAAGQELMLMALLNGSTICVRDPRSRGVRDLAEWLAGEHVTTLHGTPSLMRALVRAVPAGQELCSLRLVTTAGEKVYGRDVTAIRTHLSGSATFLNYVGSSETGIFARYAVAPCDPVPSGVVPAGRGHCLRELQVVAVDGLPVRTGEPGRLQVVSEHLSGGYVGDPEQTAARFQRLADGRTRYDTGDRAVVEGDGDLRLLGRGDRTVKVRGYLVDPSEVEAALASLEDVADVTVQPATDGADTTRLVAWVVPEPQRRAPSTVSLRTQLGTLLPDWMVPRDVVLVAALPRNTGGKVDVSALPDPPARPRPVPPATAQEAAVERVWASILKVELVGRDESFTALGGDSLAVEEMLATVASDFGVSLASADLAEHPTVREFAEVVTRARAGQAPARSHTMVRLRTEGDRPPVYCFAGAGGAAAFFDVFARLLGPDQPVVGFQVKGFEGPGIPDWTVRRTARRHVRDIEQIGSDAPVVLVGHSLGGLVALEVAHLLRARGREVGLVVLLDTYLPPALRPADAPRRWDPAEGLPAEPSSGLFKTRVQVLLAGIWRHRDWRVHQEVFHQHGARIAHVHRPTPWSGRAVVVLSNENNDEPGWWAPVLSGTHEVVRIDADHVALLKRPYVDQVAELVRSAVDQLAQEES